MKLCPILSVVQNMTLMSPQPRHPASRRVSPGARTSKKMTSTSTSSSTVAVPMTRTNCIVRLYANGSGSKSNAEPRSAPICSRSAKHDSLKRPRRRRSRTRPSSKKRQQKQRQETSNASKRKLSKRSAGSSFAQILLRRGSKPACTRSFVLNYSNQRSLSVVCATSREE